MAHRQASKPRTPDGRRRRIGLVLSGGGARGFAHIGLLKVLERRGVEVDALAGTSMGAIVAALHAHGYCARELHELAAEVSWRDVIDVSFQGRLLSGEKLHRLLAAYLPATFAELGKPLAITCTDLERGEEVVFHEGPLLGPLRASASLPGAFEPVDVDGHTLADGGITNNLPVEALALLHADVTLASDVTPLRRAHMVHPSEDGAKPTSWWSRMLASVTPDRRTPFTAVLLRVSDVMMRVLTDTRYVIHPADLRVEHPLEGYGVESFGSLDEIVAAGEANAEAAFEARPDVLRALEGASTGVGHARALPPPNAAETAAAASEATVPTAAKLRGARAAGRTAATGPAPFGSEDRGAHRRG